MCESVCRLVVLNVYSLVVWVGGVHHPIVCTYICMYVHMYVRTYSMYENTGLASVV